MELSNSDRSRSFDLTRTEMNRRSFGPSLLVNDGEEEDPEAEERPATEWGLGSYLSQLGSGSPRTEGGGFNFTESSLLPFPSGMGDQEAGDGDMLETRSMPDLDRPRVLSTATVLTPDADAAPAPPVRRIRILERRSDATRLRTQSLGPGAALELPSFSTLPTFDELHSGDPKTRASHDPLISPGPSRLSMFSTSSDDPLRRPSSSFARPQLPSSTSPRPFSTLSLAPSTTLSVAIPRFRGSNTEDDDEDDSRPLSSLSMDPRPQSVFSTSPGAFTSRFDPAMLALARQEIEKDRPVFVNKGAGAPPKVVLMPAPLAGRSPSPPRKVRVEGPDPESEEEEMDEEALAEAIRKKERPAGQLYGRSLLDVMAERKALRQGQAKHFVPGADGRRTMMDWGDSPAAQKLLAAQQSAASDETGSNNDAASPTKDKPTPMSRSKTAMSVFGPDLFYQRDMERLKAIELAEAEERAEEERKEAAIWEKERIKEEKKRSGKGKLLKSGRPSGDLVRTSEMGMVRSPTDGGFASGTLIDIPSPPPKDRTHRGMAPSLSLPQGLKDHAETTDEPWFTPASPSTHSSDESARVEYAPPPLQGRMSLESTDLPALAAPSQKEQQAAALRRAVMLGSMSPEQAAAESRRLRLDTISTPGSDDRPLGERLSLQHETQAPPPRLSLDFGAENVEYLDQEDISRPESPSADGSDDDDRPLGLQQYGKDEDDVPLGVRASMLPSARQQPDSDDDDRPLGLATPALALQHQYQQQQMYLQQQQHQSQQALYQQSQFFAQQQYAAALAQQQSGMMYGQGGPQMAGDQMAPGGMVERWRRGVES